MYLDFRGPLYSAAARHVNPPSAMTGRSRSEFDALLSDCSSACNRHEPRMTPGTVHKKKNGDRLESNFLGLKK